MVLTGGGALLRGLDKRLRHETGMPVHRRHPPGGRARLEEVPRGVRGPAAGPGDVDKPAVARHRGDPATNPLRQAPGRHLGRSLPRHHHRGLPRRGRRTARLGRRGHQQRARSDAARGLRCGPAGQQLLQQPRGLRPSRPGTPSSSGRWRMRGPRSSNQELERQSRISRSDRPADDPPSDDRSGDRERCLQLRWTVTLGAGSDSGIALNMPVVTGASDRPRLVGRVIRVTPISSIVQLLIDRDFAVPATLSTSHEAGIVEGRGEDELGYGWWGPAWRSASPSRVRVHARLQRRG